MTDKPANPGGPIDPSGAKAARAEITTVGIPVEYMVIDHPWQPDDPATTETMLDGHGQQGWRLSTVYLDPIREKTRWIFIR